MFQSRVPNTHHEINDENDMRTLLPPLLGWPQSPPPTIAPLSGGITNTLYKVSTGGDTVVLRIFGAACMFTRADRKRETDIFEQLGYAHVAPRLRAVFANGRVEEYIHRARCVTLHEMTATHVAHAVAVRMARLHAFRPADHPAYRAVPALWSHLTQWASQSTALDADGRFKNLGIDVPKYVRRIQAVRDIIQAGDHLVVFAHNDLQMGNIMTREHTHECMLIDYEYGNYNYQAFDIGNFFAEAMGGVDDGRLQPHLYPCEDFRRLFCREYSSAFYGHAPSEDSLDKLVHMAERFSTISHLFWGIWALTQSASSQIEFPYLSYGRQRLAVFDENFPKHFC